MRRGTGVLLLSWVLSACEAPFAPSSLLSDRTAGASSPASAASLDADFAVPFSRILCFGDSLTAGVTLLAPELGQSVGPQAQLTPVEGYVPKLALLLGREYGEGASLNNSGVPGETTERGLRRLPGEIAAYRPDLLLLLQGVVDVNNDNPRFSAVQANLREMVRLAKSRGVTVVIGTIPPLNPEGFRTTGMANVPVLNERIRQIAAAEEIGLADHESAFAGDLTLQGPDGLHPNDAGYQMMAETWFQAIQTIQGMVH